jgi:hypothetical protein
MNRSLLLLAGLALVLSACDGTDPVDPVVVETATVAELSADPAVRDPNTGAVVQTGRYTLYSLRENRVVLSHTATNRADSASTAWDIGFQGTNIIVNGGASGPGLGQAVVVTATFDELTDVPAGTTFRADGDNTCPSGAPRAVCGGSGNGWYTYVPFAGGVGGYIVPTPGRTLLVRTADGQGTAKIRFTSYYQGSPDPATISLSSRDRYYSFDFALNPNGTSFVASE